MDDLIRIATLVAVAVVVASSLIASIEVVGKDEAMVVFRMGRTGASMLETRLAEVTQRWGGGILGVQVSA
jgi:regulator of protease activity HflC (stomatin/prohibitin superfamily)